MKKTIYDFSKAIKELDQWYKPSEYSAILKNAVLELARIEDDDNGINPPIIKSVQLAALEVCDLLDKIIEIEVEQ